MTNEKLDLASPDLVNENFEKLAQLFPNCVTESADGKAIDFDLLKQELSHAVVEGTKERYRLEWPGKREAIVTANLPTTKTLRPVREDSVDFDNTENLYIEGDNLEVLKLLQESYLGKIKMIYIDPPYNTGNDFVYKDNFTQDSEEYKEESGLKDEYNQRLQSNPDTSGRYHSDWLSMMYPRLKLARNLLSNDGIIAISIDDNEVDNLCKICDEVFSEVNRISIAGWQKVYSPKNQARYLSNDYEYVLLYAKSLDDFKVGLLPRTSEMNKRYKNPDNDFRGDWKPGDLVAAGERSGGHYIVKNPYNNEEFDVPSGKHWAFSESRMKELLKEDRIYFGKNKDSFPSFKQFLTEVKQGRVASSLLTYKDYGHTDEAKKDFIKLFGESGRTIFETLKPVRLIQNLARIANTQNGDIVLDFFSGSATSAHSIMQLNSEENGKIKHIQVQIPEQTDENSEAFKEGYKNICEIGKERIRRAAKKIKEETNADIDYGFRVYRLDDSNMQDVYYKPQEYSQANLELFSDNIKPDRTPDDLLAQVMLDWGLPLSLKIEQAVISGKKVFKVSENSLFACFDTGIDEAFTKEIAKEMPLRIVFKDSGFKDDTAKTNVKQLLKQLSPETEMKVI
ncbi:adenine-specific DNA-methyltransferase [Mariniflexile fucanivorans]|uniref:site-specific DNA-methyltransferase (adenine-specific) n=1 Tax=Mariniflexile fucanivorans TaxID=264023 RepID=A0A4R1RFV8_9FLAO|nr:site-specific DNA-methyltransferase [Mariniflexile fucanivorans]TCL64560.1 adenine-specific DNA-methyltransferase [Mariniflexile fucanivorans]